MKNRSWLAAVLAAACGQDPSPPPRLHFTCGDPVCRGYSAPAGVPRCTTEQGEGAACRAVGLGCDPVDECNRLLVCAREDPTMGMGGCPISLAAFKKDVRYLEAGDLDRQHAAVLRLPLATWRYRSDGDGVPPRLGFLIDDAGAAACVDRSRGRVDLYGYTSMTLAAVQVQAREIAELRREVAALRAEVRAPGRGR